MKDLLITYGIPALAGSVGGAYVWGIVLSKWKWARDRMLAKVKA